jgi:hypothetical protein
MATEKADRPRTREVAEQVREEDLTHGYTAESNQLPPGYFLSPFFLGSFLATGMNLMGSTGGFGLVAPVLLNISASFGFSPAIIWLALVYTIG